MIQRLFLLGVMFFATGSTVGAEPPDFVAVVGTVEKCDKELVTITLADKAKKAVDLKITGTSNFFIIAKQLRAGKAVLAQRKAKAADLAKGQAIAAIYAEADKEFILLNAVIRPVVKAGELGENDILDIAKAQVAKNETWADRAEYTLTTEGEGWTVEVWRFPNVPGGVRAISIDRQGKVLTYARGK